MCGGVFDVCVGAYLIGVCVGGYSIGECVCGVWAYLIGVCVCVGECICLVLLADICVMVHTYC